MEIAAKALGFLFLPRFVPMPCTKGGGRGAREQPRSEDYGSARAVAAPGTPRADPRASNVSRVAAPGTASAGPRARIVSRVAPARNVGVSDVLLFDSDAL